MLEARTTPGRRASAPATRWELALRGHTMKATCWSTKTLIAVAFVALCLFGPVRGAEKGKRTGKGGKDDVKPVVIEIDLRTLPPDLAKQLLLHWSKTKGKTGSAAKGAKDA